MRVMKTLTKLVFCCVVCTAAVLDSTWKADTRFNGLITDRCLLDTFFGISLINCASRCSNRDLCVSFFYIKRSKTCNHHFTKFEIGSTSSNSTFMIKQPGAVYFYNAADNRQNITEPCAAVRCTEFTYLPSVNAYFEMAQNISKSRENASEMCIRNGGRLASPKDQRTLDAIEEMIHTRMGGIENLKAFWVSARYSPTIKDFVWSDDNSTVSPGLWHPGKPEYFKRAETNTKCAVLVPLYKFKLADYLCNITGDSIIPLCECT